MTEQVAHGVGDPEDRRRHLDYIQAVVKRMSVASSTTKSWLLPVITAAYGYALSANVESVALLGIAAVALFAFLDANYLRQEQAYRRLYDAVVRGAREVPVFSLDPSYAAEPAVPAVNWWQATARILGRWIPDRKVWFSWSIAPFYGGLALIGLVIYIGSR